MLASVSLQGKRGEKIPLPAPRAGDTLEEGVGT